MSADIDYDEELELRGVWLSRLMFGFIADACHHNDPPVFTETRSYEEFQAGRLSAGGEET